MSKSNDILADIVAARKISVTKDKARMSVAELELKTKKMAPPKNFLEAVSQNGKVTLIAEMKRKSPSAGLLCDPYDPGGIAKTYEQGGASALSVLAEPEYFGGKIEDIRAVHQVSSLPILRKDFIFDPYQIVEARVFGASAVLLIADMLSAVQTKELVAIAHQYNLTALVEVFSFDSLAAALDSGSKLIGINTRNLRTLEMLPDNIENISKQIPREFVVVAESGVKSVDQVKKFKELNVSSMLVGESLLKHTQRAEAVRALVEAGQ